MPVQLERPGRGSERGVSALELVLVVTATAVVAAVCASGYRAFQARSQISASVADTTAARALVTAAFEREGSPPRNAAAAGIDSMTRSLLLGTYVAALEVDNGRIDLRFGDNAATGVAGKSLSLTPFETAAGEVVWVCGNERPGVGLKPLGFSGGVHPIQAATAIEERYLPPECR
jgi:type IV pilus assembly protein PilA